MRTLRDWDSSSPLSASHLQEPVEALRELADARAYEATRQEGKVRQFVVLTITNQGPTGQPDFSNNAYWGAISYIAGGNQGDNLTVNPDKSELTPDSSGDTPAPVVVVAYNTTEESTHAHGVPTNGTAHVVAAVIQDYGDPSRTRYLFAYGGSLPAGTGRYKVLQLIDDNSPGTPGWDYERFS